MLNEPLPRTLDIRKAATRGVTVSGVLDPTQLPRFLALLAEDGGKIAADCDFFRDEENRYLVRVKSKVEVAVHCQRCLLPLPLTLATDNTLAAVWSDEEASHLPRRLDALLVAEDEVDNLWDMVEDELILALPAFSYHETQECKAILAEFTAQPTTEVAVAEEANPFNVLAQLKPGDKTRS